ncbi:MAG TPA: hypothetical protein PLO69_14590 [Gammaproteobacteria bacterium]|nr:hypothetical protein [Gammaproteobacteria bacterium]
MEKATPQLASERFKLAEHERNIHSITVEDGITRGQIIDPAFLAHVAAKLRPYDQIEVRCDDGALFARLLVLQAERTWARVHVLEWHNLTTRDVSLTQTGKQEQSAPAGPAADKEQEYMVAHKGPHKKWCVIRKSDGGYMREGEETKATATNWLADWLRVTA